MGRKIVSEKSNCTQHNIAVVRRTWGKYMKYLSMIHTSSSEEGETKMFFRWQLSKLNLSAHSNALGQDYTSGSQDEQLPSGTMMSGSTCGGWGAAGGKGCGYCPGNAFSIQLGVSSFQHPDRMEQKRFFLSRTTHGRCRPESIAMKLIHEMNDPLMLALSKWTGLQTVIWTKLIKLFSQVIFSLDT